VPIVPRLSLALASLLVAACSDSPKALTRLEREVWALEYQLPPGLGSPEPGTPGYPDVERPRVKGQAVLRAIPPGTPEAVAIEQLRARGFVVEVQAPPSDPRRYVSGEKQWCARFACCATQVSVAIAGGRVVAAVASDHEWGRYLRIPTVGNALFGPANCDAGLPPLRGG